jgi:hypothetical protein
MGQKRDICLMLDTHIQYTIDNHSNSRIICIYTLVPLIYRDDTCIALLRLRQENERALQVHGNQLQAYLTAQAQGGVISLWGAAWSGRGRGDSARDSAAGGNRASCETRNLRERCISRMGLQDASLHCPASNRSRQLVRTCSHPGVELS